MYPEPEVNYTIKNTKPFALIAGFVVLFVIIIALAVSTIVLTLSYDKVYSGVYLNGDNISHLSKEEVGTYLDNMYNKPLQNLNIQIMFKDRTWSIKASDLGVKFNSEEIIDAVLTPGHDGGTIKRLSEIVSMRINKRNIELTDSFNGKKLVTYDDDKLTSFAKRISDEAYSLPVDHKYKIGDGAVTITAGSPGYILNLENVKTEVMNIINNMISQPVNIESIAELKFPEAMDIDKIYKETFIAPIDASYKAENGKAVKTAEKSGKELSKQQLYDVATEAAQNPGKQFVLNYNTVEAKVKLADLPDVSFDIEIGKWTTTFSSGDKNRNTNIKLATQTINNYVILPGKEFSFNEFVGDTTKEKGYKLAGTFVNGRTENSYGGGVCQVSSTLYLAAIHGGVTISERSCHSMPIGYAKRGLDAAIAYPYKDLKIKNTTDAPILIVGTTTDTSVTFKIMGSYKDPTVTYDFEVKLDSKYSSGGNNYAKYTTYRITKVNGVQTKYEKFSTSTYKV